MRHVLWLIVLVCVGCSSTTRRTYEVAVVNEGDQPVTLWLTKDGPPDELGWISPERMAVAGVRDEDLPIQTLPPGATATIGPVTGRFAHDARGVVRVYAGALSLDDVLAVSTEGPLRRDVVLKDGPNRLIVQPAAILKVERAE